MAGKTKSQKKKALDMRSKMYLVLALCSVMLLVSVGISLVLIGGIDLGGADAPCVATVDRASQVHQVPHIGLPQIEPVASARNVKEAPMGAQAAAAACASLVGQIRPTPAATAITT